MTGNIRTLASRLSMGPMFLLLGQASVGASAARLRPDLKNPMSLTEANYRDYNNAISELPPSSELLSCTSVPWNGVLTSRVDSHVTSLLRPIGGE